MDFVFNCAACHGPLVARTDLRGLVAQCAHCAGGIVIRSGKPVTEAVVSAILDIPLPTVPTGKPVLRRVRPAARHSSADASHTRIQLPRNSRTS